VNITHETSSWLDELRDAGLHLRDEPGAGAHENLWCISSASDAPINARDLVALLHAALGVRREQVCALAVTPVTFYAWHDDMAGQLRLSTACCTPDTLPFGCAVVLVDHPGEIVAEVLQSPQRGGTPRTDLHDSNTWLEPGERTATSPPLKVWGVELHAGPVGLSPARRSVGGS
jgi:hypothetical protein